MPVIAASEIRSLPLFVGVRDTDFDTLMGAALLQHPPARTALIKEGQDAGYLHVPLDGSIASQHQAGDPRVCRYLIGSRHLSEGESA